MARHRRHYRGLVRFPGLGALSMPSSVKPVDVVLGAALGLAGSAGLKMGASKIDAAPEILKSGSPLLCGAVTGAVLYLAQKKSNPGRAAGHALGAILGGVAIWGAGMLQAAMAPATATSQTAGWGFAPRTLPAGMGAPLFNNPRLMGMGGPIFNNPNVNLGRLAQLQGMGDENEDGMFPAP